MIATLRSALPRTAAFLTMAAMSAPAAPVVLNFDGFACNNGAFGPTNINCTASNQSVGNDYGSTTGLTVFFANSPNFGGPSFSNQGQWVVLRGADDGSGGFTFGVTESSNTTSNYSEILFTPAPGYEVSLVSFFHRNGSATANIPFFRLFDPNGAVVYSLDAPPASAAVTRNVNSAYFSGPISFRYATTTGVLVLDDITLDLRQTSTGGGGGAGGGVVPEPATWAMTTIALGALAWRRRR